MKKTAAVYHVRHVRRIGINVGAIARETFVRGNARQFGKGYACPASIAHPSTAPATGQAAG